MRNFITSIKIQIRMLLLWLGWLDFLMGNVGLTGTYVPRSYASVRPRKGVPVSR